MVVDNIFKYENILPIIRQNIYHIDIILTLLVVCNANVKYFSRMVLILYEINLDILSSFTKNLFHRSFLYRFDFCSAVKSILELFVSKMKLLRCVSYPINEQLFFFDGHFFFNVESLHKVKYFLIMYDLFVYLRKF